MASISNLSFSSKVQLAELENMEVKSVHEKLIQPSKRNRTAQRTMETVLQEPNTEWILVYTLPRKATIDTSTHIFQYKVLSNIIYLNNRLGCKIFGCKCKIG